MGIAIWLVPPPSAFEPLSQTISSIAHDEKSPTFLPHITLLSVPFSQAILTDPRSIVPPQLPPSFPITFTRVCTGRSFFQSVLVEVGIGGEDEPLSKLYDETLCLNEDRFRTKGGEAAVKAKRRYYPHLSLYYGDRTEEDRRDIIAKLEESGIVDSSKGFPVVAGVEGGFQVGEIWVVNCEGATAEWRTLLKVELSEL